MILSTNFNYVLMIMFNYKKTITKCNLGLLFAFQICKKCEEEWRSEEMKSLFFNTFKGTICFKEGVYGAIGGRAGFSVELNLKL